MSRGNCGECWLDKASMYGVKIHINARLFRLLSLNILKTILGFDLALTSILLVYHIYAIKYAYIYGYLSKC